MGGIHSWHVSNTSISAACVRAYFWCTRGRGSTHRYRSFMHCCSLCSIPQSMMPQGDNAGSCDAFTGMQRDCHTCTCVTRAARLTSTNVEGRSGEFPDLQNVFSQLFCFLFFVFCYRLFIFYGMLSESYLSFGKSHNTVINMVWTKRVIRKCISIMAHAPL
jgi:hypothetical protein